MLEAMAMRKPVLMTRSGCLHFDPSSRNFGILVEPGDSQGWSDAMNRILNDYIHSEWEKMVEKFQKKNSQ